MHQLIHRFLLNLNFKVDGVHKKMYLKIDDFKGMMAAVRDIMVDKKEFLVELDAKMGDGDLGLSMSKGFIEASKSMDNFTDIDIGKALFQSAIAMNNAASSTMGTLVSSAIMNAGKEVKGAEEIVPTELITMAQAAVDIIIKRGKAKIGEKTILDALVPAVDALKKDIIAGKSLEEAFGAAAKAAEEGVELTKDMIAQHGRAYYYGEKSRGVQDPGATMVMLTLQSLKKYFNKKNRTDKNRYK